MFRSEHARRLGSLGHVNGDEIRKGQHVVDVFIHLDAERCSALLAAIRVVSDKVHAKCGRPLGNEPAHAAKAEYGKRLLVQLAALERARSPLPCMHRSVRLGNVPRTRKDERHSVLGS